MSINVQNIRQSHEVHREGHGKRISVLGQTLAEVKIQRDIFQETLSLSLSLLYFVIAMM